MTAIHPSSFIPLWSGIVALFERKPCTTGGCVENPTTWKAEDSTKRSSVWELCPKQPVACPNSSLSNIAFLRSLLYEAARLRRVPRFERVSRVAESYSQTIRESTLR
jgi:hypothetical protein